MKLSNKGLGVLLAVTGIIMFSAKAIMVKLGYRHDVDAVTLLLLRMLFALPIYLFVSVKETKNQNVAEFRSKDLWSVVGLGVVGYYLASYFDFYGLQFISASLERLILFIYPTLVIIISAVVLKKKATKMQIYAILITYLGVFVAFADDLNMDSEGFWVGTISIFLSAFTYAIYLVGSGAMIPKLGPVRFTAYVMTVSCFMVILHYLAINSFEVLHQPWEVYALGFAMAMISTVIPSFLIAEAIKRLGASNFAIYGSLGPISTIVLAIIFLGERIDLYQIIGTVIVIIGVSIINLRKS